MQHVSIRLAGLDDHATLLRCAANEELSFDLDVWRKCLASADVFTYLAEDQDVFGFVTAGYNPVLPEQSGEILGVFVAPQHRNKGFGKKLMVRGLTVLKRRGYSTAQTFLTAAQPDALSLLSCLGFEASGLERQTSGMHRQIGYKRELSDFF